jgi:hypothetical protein
MSIKTQLNQIHKANLSKSEKTQAIEDFFNSERVKNVLIDLDSVGLLSKASSTGTFLHKRDDYRLLLPEDRVLRLDKYIQRTEYRLTGHYMRIIPIYKDCDISYWRKDLSIEIYEDCEVSVTLLNENLDLDAVLKVLEEIFFSED